MAEVLLKSGKKHYVSLKYVIGMNFLHRFHFVSASVAAVTFTQITYHNLFTFLSSKASYDISSKANTVNFFH